MVRSQDGQPRSVDARLQKLQSQESSTSRLGTDGFECMILCSKMKGIDLMLVILEQIAVYHSMKRSTRYITIR